MYCSTAVLFGHEGVIADAERAKQERTPSCFRAEDGDKRIKMEGF